MANKRFEYWKDSDTAYDTKIKYGQYFHIIDKKDMVCLLNWQEETIERLKTIRNEQTKTILKQKRKMQELEQEKESWKNSVCHDINLKSMLSFEIGKLTETKDIEKFLDFYYKHFCKINGDSDG